MYDILSPNLVLRGILTARFTALPFVKKSAETTDWETLSGNALETPTALLPDEQKTHNTDQPRMWSVFHRRPRPALLSSEAEITKNRQRTAEALPLYLVSTAETYHSGQEYSDRLKIHKNTNRSFYFRPGWHFGSPKTILGAERERVKAGKSPRSLRCAPACVRGGSGIKERVNGGCSIRYYSILLKRMRPENWQARFTFVFEQVYLILTRRVWCKRVSVRVGGAGGRTAAGVSGATSNLTW